MKQEWAQCSGPQCKSPTWTSKRRGIAGLCFECHHRAGYQYFLGDKDWRRKLVLFNAIRGNEQFLGVPPESRGLWKTSDKQFYWSTVSTIWHSDSSPARCGIGWEPPTGLFIFSVQDMLYRCLFLQEPTSVPVHRYWPRDVFAFCICTRQ